MNAAANLNWLVGRFVQQVAAVRQAVVVPSDGLPLAVSDGVDRETVGDRGDSRVLVRRHRLRAHARQTPAPRPQMTSAGRSPATNRR